MLGIFDLIHIIILILVTVFLIVVIVFGLKYRERHKKIIEQQALKRNGKVKYSMAYPELEFPYLDHTVKVYSRPGTRYSSPETWVEVTLKNPSIYKFTVYRERLTSKIGKSLGMQDIQIEDQLRFHDLV